MELETTKISTVVPATSRVDEDTACHVSNMDLLMKLHYIRAVHFFSADASQRLTTQDLKKPMFPLLDRFSHLSGRIRVSESGRPFIKCNDAGVRIAEWRCEKTVAEWFQENGYGVEGLVVDHVLGPDLGFSPLVFFKFTWFKCGGLCMGLSWSHVLGDAISAFNFITMWTQALAGHVLPNSLPNQQILTKTEFQHNNPVLENPVLARRATKTLNEQWLATNDTKTFTHTFHLTSKQLDHLVTITTLCDENQITKTTLFFEIISALVWKYIAQIKENLKVVTICTRGTRQNDEFLSNGFILSKVETNVEVTECDVSYLAKLIAKEKVVENHVIENLLEENEGREDFIVYGANLTFVDLEEANVYGMKINGKSPIVANCVFHGVGDQGVVLVLPASGSAPEEGNNNGGNGRIVTVSLPKKELEQLKNKLGRELDNASSKHS